MSDDIDRAQPEMERAILEAMRKRKPQGPEPTGFCLWCEEPLDDHSRWCGPGCRDVWELLHRRR